MRVIDETYLAFPFFGSRQRARWLQREGYGHVSPSEPVEENCRASDLPVSADLSVERSNQVWATNITYIPVNGGVIYLCAVIDWHGQCMLAWELSNTLDVRASGAAAMAMHGKPEIFNTDQGSQFASAAFTHPLLGAGVKLSMDGKAAARAAVAQRETRRSLPAPRYETMIDAHAHLDAYFRFYNERRPHSAHGRQTPAEVYRQPQTQQAA